MIKQYVKEPRYPMVFIYIIYLAQLKSHKRNANKVIELMNTIIRNNTNKNIDVLLFITNQTFRVLFFKQERKRKKKKSQTLFFY